MVQIPPITNAAASILAQVAQAGENRPAPGTSADEIVQITNQAAKPKLAPPATSPQSKLSQQLFSLNHQSLSKLKMQLFERVGEALGVKLEHFAHFDDFASEVEAAYRLVLREAGPLAIKAIERETGLDELGLTLRDVIESMKEPEKDDKVSKALTEKHHLEGPSEVDGQIQTPMTWF